MRPHRLPLVALAISVLGPLGACSTTPSPSQGTPDAAFARYQESLASQDFAALYDLLSQEAQATFAEYIDAMSPPVRLQVERLGLDPDEIRALPPRDAFVRITARSVELQRPLYDELVAAEPIEPPTVLGTIATVRYRLPAGDVEAMEFIRERDGWKIAEP